MPENDEFSDDIGFEEDFDEVDAVEDDDLGDSSASSQPDEADFQPGAEEELDDDLTDLQIDGAVLTMTLYGCTSRRLVKSPSLTATVRFG